MAEKNEENKGRYQVGQVSTQHEDVIVDTQDKNKALTVLEGIAQILNKLDSIEKAIK